ncbi:hypothetical protein SKAU_G00108390 [Synaphobranchus kaupii]|uniref:Uncharacterized protein n=1 Tax=Synaphobranchus kaupii TaxID=118154 RepID=A0A9Q1FZZ5_SYNKA|nr:hypothetical protein SKAU_G00108390 [Synaphobranchus kaupii]
MARSLERCLVSEPWQRVGYAQLGTAMALQMAVNTRDGTSIVFSLSRSQKNAPRHACVPSPFSPAPRRDRKRLAFGRRSKRLGTEQGCGRRCCCTVERVLHGDGEGVLGLDYGLTDECVSISDHVTAAAWNTCGHKITRHYSSGIWDAILYLVVSTESSVFCMYRQ